MYIYLHKYIYIYILYIYMYLCRYIYIYIWRETISQHRCVLVDSQSFLRVDASLPPLPLPPPFVEYLGQETQSFLGVSVRSETLSEDGQSSSGMPGSENFDSICKYSGAQVSTKTRVQSWTEYTVLCKDMFCTCACLPSKRNNIYSYSP